jgi:hypothetical protein
MNVDFNETNSFDNVTKWKLSTAFNKWRANSFHRTYIFTFDSLGTEHPRTVRKLTNYLRMEAQQKNGVDAVGTVQGMAVPVNF